MLSSWLSVSSEVDEKINENEVEVMEIYALPRDLLDDTFPITNSISQDLQKDIINFDKSTLNKVMYNRIPEQIELNRLQAELEKIINKVKIYEHDYEMLKNMIVIPVNHLPFYVLEVIIGYHLISSIINKIWEIL